MIDSVLATAKPAAPERVLTFVKNERMGGYVPKWETQTNAQNSIETNITNALNGTHSEISADTALAYKTYENAQPQTKSQFGFADLLDMVNPLHHVPVVGHLYRELTGDEIKPASKIMGGALFGGVAGAATGIIDAIIVEETGKDMAGNAMAIAFGRTDEPQTTQLAQNTPPEIQIEKALSKAQNPYDSEMALTLLSFSDLGTSENNTSEKDKDQNGLYALVG